MSLRRQFLTAVVGVAVLAVTACGSDADTGSAAGSTAAPAGSSAAESPAESGAAESPDESGAAESPAESDAAESDAAESGAAESPAESGAAESGQAALGPECTPESLQTTAAGTLTIATSEPAFEPWMVDNDPANGKGFESAVAYAVAEKLGYAEDQVAWVRVGFDEAIAKQDGWDFDINQFSISDDRKKVVDFSSGYYDVTQVVITVKGSPIDGVSTIAELKDAKLGAMNGTTSLSAVNDVIQPSARPSIFKDNALAAQALQNGQIDGLVVDLPTGFYMTGAQLTDGMMIGQLPGTADTAEQFGLLLAKDSALTPCVSQAVDALRADGTLDSLTDEWLGGDGVAPVLD